MSCTGDVADSLSALVPLLGDGMSRSVACLPHSWTRVGADCLLVSSALPGGPPAMSSTGSVVACFSRDATARLMALLGFCAGILAVLGSALTWLGTQLCRSGASPVVQGLL